jgi:hypothetical protein
MLIGNSPHRIDWTSTATVRLFRSHQQGRSSCAVLALTRRFGVVPIGIGSIAVTRLREAGFDAGGHGSGMCPACR